MKINDNKMNSMLQKQLDATKATKKEVAKTETPTVPTVNVNQFDADEFIKSENNKPVTYDKNSINAIDKKTVASQIADAKNQKAQDFHKMLMSMVGKEFKEISASLMKEIAVSPEEALAAQEAIAEGGEWSVDVVADGILDMAKSLSGGDPSKIEMLKNAVIKGFKEAEKAWGDELPDICQQTMDKVMAGFDQWKTESANA